MKGAVYMCTKNQLYSITTSISNKAKDLFNTKLDSVILYGSYARGDFDQESDIDILVIIDCSESELKNIRFMLSECASDLSLENDVTISVLIVDLYSFNRYKAVLPFYENIEREGLKIA